MYTENRHTDIDVFIAEQANICTFRMNLPLLRLRLCSRRAFRNIDVPVRDTAASYVDTQSLERAEQRWEEEVEHRGRVPRRQGQRR